MFRQLCIINTLYLINLTIMLDVIMCGSITKYLVFNVRRSKREVVATRFIHLLKYVNIKQINQDICVCK